jgi:hypothetical protein
MAQLLIFLQGLRESQFSSYQLLHECQKRTFLATPFFQQELLSASARKAVSELMS